MGENISEWFSWGINWEVHAWSISVSWAHIDYRRSLSFFNSSLHGWTQESGHEHEWESVHVDCLDDFTILSFVKFSSFRIFLFNVVYKHWNILRTSRNFFQAIAECLVIFPLIRLVEVMINTLNLYRWIRVFNTGFDLSHLIFVLINQDYIESHLCKSLGKLLTNRITCTWNDDPRAISVSFLKVKRFSYVVGDWGIRHVVNWVEEGIQANGVYQSSWSSVAPCKDLS